MMKILRVLSAVVAVVVIGSLVFQSVVQNAANKEVDEANQLTTDGNAALAAAAKQYGEVFSAENLTAFPGNREKLTALGKEPSAGFDKMIDNYRKAADLFEKASNEGVDDILKKYWKLRVDAMRKMADSKAHFPQVIALLKDETIQDAGALELKIRPLTAEAHRLFEEAMAISKESDKIQKENPDKIEQT